MAMRAAVLAAYFGRGVVYHLFRRRTVWRGTLLFHRRTWAVVCVSMAACLLLVYTLPVRSVWYLGHQSYPPVLWYVHPYDRNPTEVRHVVFIKVHKAASTTLYNIFVRFSISRELNVMFPREWNLLGEKSRELFPLVDHPPSPPFLFDILCNHVVFDAERIRPYFPDDAVYVTILREPFDQMQSAYHYYRNRFNVDYLTASSNLTDFLTKVQFYEPEDPLQSYTNNRMSIDLGLPPRQITNASYVTTFVQNVNNIFDLVLIAERFDESMVLLKRRLRWTMKDILYTQLNRRKKSNQQKVEVDFSLKPAFEVLDKFDFALYDHFSQVFDEKVLSEGPSFQDEVKHFGGVEERIQSFCDYDRHEGNVTIAGSEWNEEFVFQTEECEAIEMEEIMLDNRAKYWQQKRMFYA